MNEDDRFHAVEPFLKEDEEEHKQTLDRDDMADLLAHSGGPLLSLICTNNVLLNRRTLTEKLVMYDRLSDIGKEMERFGEGKCRNNYERALIYLYLAMRCHATEMKNNRTYKELVEEVSTTVLRFLNEMQAPGDDNKEKKEEEYIKDPDFFDPSCH